MLKGREETADLAREGSASSLAFTALLLTLAMMVGCGGGSTGKTPDAGKVGTDADASNALDASLETEASDAGDAANALDAAGDAPRTCLADGGTAADPLEGTWVDTTSAEQWTVSNGGGCSVWIGRSPAGDLCDSCNGHYTVTGANTATLMLTCTMRGSCSVSPDHMDVGTVTITGCSLRYDYNFGNGGSSSSVTKLDDVPRDLCPADAGAGN